jgi:hypothetical protein
VPLRENGIRGAVIKDRFYLEGPTARAYLTSMMEWTRRIGTPGPRVKTREDIKVAEQDNKARGCGTGCQADGANLYPRSRRVRGVRFVLSSR